MFSTDELALIEAIHDNPRDDAIRLVYADWLDEHGQGDMAEFIRIQCREPYLILDVPDDPRIALETHQIKFNDPDRVHRAIELLKRLHSTERFPDVVTDFWSEYVRGLPVYWQELGDNSLEDDSLLARLRRTPLARFRVSLTTSRLTEWLRHPLIQFVDEIWLGSSYEFNFGGQPILTEDDIQALAASPIIDRLSRLNLGCEMTAKAGPLAAKLLHPHVAVTYNY